MKRKHAITTAVVVVILAVLVFLQVRHWHNFDWAKFRAVTTGVNWWSIALGVAFTYFVYILRALRWSVFLKPTKDVPFTRLIVPQFVGFTGLALLGRPGEFVRPYLIARQEKLPFSSQLATWIVERVFDISSVALLLGINLVLPSGGHPAFPLVKKAGIAMLGLAAFLSLMMFGLWIKAEAISSTFERILKPLSKKVAESVCSKLRTFGEGLHTLADAKAFLAVSLISIAIWFCVAESYIHVLHAYPETTVTTVYDSGLPKVGSTVRVHEMKLHDVFIVMISSMFGSVVQLPGVGGGSQLAVISVLHSPLFASEPYNITPELAVSCGMMLWLVTFMSVIPAGLLIAHFNRISLRAISEESEEEAEEEIAHPHSHDADAANRR